jgi:hypothetical protein
MFLQVALAIFLLVLVVCLGCLLSAAMSGTRRDNPNAAKTPKLKREREKDEEVQLDQIPSTSKV